METAVHNQSIISESPSQAGKREVTILCCHCGASFSASSTGTNICIKCLSEQVDITTGITREGILEFCKKCERYQRPPWVRAELESKELLEICLKKIKGLNKIKLVDASFIWTEPHSRRVKVKLTIQKEVMNNVSVQQTCVTEFVINYLQCEDCKKEFTPHKWKANVQVRQHVDHKRTFFYLEQIILKQSLHEKMLNVKEVAGGIDFYFKDKAHAQKLVEFLRGVLPIKVKSSKQLISADEQNSVYNFKFVFSVQIPKICKDDLVILTPKLCGVFGGCSKVLLCTKVASVIQLVDLHSMKIIDMSGTQYFQYENDMQFVSSKGNLTEFMVFDVETSDPKYASVSFIGTRFRSSRATIGRISDWENFDVKTHMGDVLNDGSTVLGYDLTRMNLTGLFDEAVELGAMPDVIIVKKIYPEKKKANKKRIWKLKHLEKQERGMNNIHKANAQKDKDDKDYEEFLDDVEMDPELRAQMMLFKDEKALSNVSTVKESEHVDESTSEIQSDAPSQVKTKRVSKKRQQAADKKKQDALKAEEDHHEEEIKPEGKDLAGVKIEELLNDLNLEDDKVIRVGTALGHEDEKEAEDEDDDDDGIEVEKIEKQ